jgi:hypothetical protein
LLFIPTEKAAAIRARGDLAIARFALTANAARRPIHRLPRVTASGKQLPVSRRRNDGRAELHIESETFRASFSAALVHHAQRLDLGLELGDLALVVI